MTKTTINNGDSGLAARTALNAMFTELYAGRVYVLAQSGAAVSHTGDTAETILATVTIPAGLMRANDTLEVTSLWEHTNSGNTKTERVRLGGIGGAIFSAFALTTTATQQGLTRIANANSVSAQVGANTANNGVGASASAKATGAIDMSVAQDVVLTAQCGNGADTITLLGYTVKLLLAPT